MQAKKRQVFNLSYLKQNKITPSSAARTSIPKSTLLIYSGSPFCFTSPLRHAVNSSTRNANAIYAALNKIPLAADISNFNTLLARIKIPKAMYMLWQKLNSAIAISCFVTTLTFPISALSSVSFCSFLFSNSFSSIFNSSLFLYLRTICRISSGKEKGHPGLFRSQKQKTRHQPG